MPRPLRLVVLPLALILGLASAETRADIIATVAADVTTVAGGYLYTYTVTDLPTSTSALSEFDLSLTSLPTSGIYTPPGAPITAITMANGFINTYTLGDPSISFQSTDASTDIQPGAFGSFSFMSTYAPVVEYYQLATYDGSGAPPVIGLTITPATIPEPSSLVLTGLVGVGFLGWQVAGRRRRVAGL